MNRGAEEPVGIVLSVCDVSFEMAFDTGSVKVVPVPPCMKPTVEKIRPLVDFVFVSTSERARGNKLLAGPFNFAGGRLGDDGEIVYCSAEVAGQIGVLHEREFKDKMMVAKPLWEECIGVVPPHELDDMFELLAGSTSDGAPFIID